MTSASVGEHWERVWEGAERSAVGWYQATPEPSLQMIEALELPRDAPIVDVGGGASGLAGELLARGYSDLTVADISPAALREARASLGDRAERIDWVIADVRSHDFGRRFEVWHDRAVFHFLVDEADRARYLDVLERSLLAGAQVIVATFGPDGPTRCSGLPTARYGAPELAEAFEPVAELVSDRLVVHETPSGNEQQFLYARLAARSG